MLFFVTMCIGPNSKDTQVCNLKTHTNHPLFLPVFWATGRWVVNELHYNILRRHTAVGHAKEMSFWLLARATNRGRGNRGVWCAAWGVLCPSICCEFVYWFPHQIYTAVHNYPVRRLNYVLVSGVNGKIWICCTPKIKIDVSTLCTLQSAIFSNYKWQ